MVNIPNFKEKIINELDGLNWEQQKKMLDYVLSIKLSQIKGTKGNELLMFSGAINKEDLGAMISAIAEGCEKVDDNGW